MAVTLREELVEDILVRLPTKSLMRCKSVKRTWNVLFKTNTFVKRHGERGLESDEQFMIFDVDPLEVFNRITLLSSNEPTLLELPAVEYLNVLGHCNGIMLLYCNDGDINMWNPATKEVKLIPPSSYPLLHSPQVLSGCYGFGADSNSFDAFKLIQVYMDFGDNVAAEIYNSTTNSWSWLHNDHVDDANYFFHPLTASQQLWDDAIVNGVFYWLFHDCTTSILSFDFSSNTFRKLDAPTLFLHHAQLLHAGHSLAS